MQIPDAKYVVSSSHETRGSSLVWDSFLVTVIISVRISGKSPAPKKTITVSSFHHSSNLIATIPKNATNSDTPKFPPLELVSEEDEWEVEQILQRSKNQKGRIAVEGKMEGLAKGKRSMAFRGKPEHTPRLRTEYEERVSKRRKT